MRQFKVKCAEQSGINEKKKNKAGTDSTCHHFKRSQRGSDSNEKKSEVSSLDGSI